MPTFIGNRLLRETAWYIAEAVVPPILKRLDQIMGALVSVDSDVLAALTTLSQTVDSEVGTIIAKLNANQPIAAGDLSGIQTALSDANTQLSAAVASGTATSPTDPSAPTDGSTPPADDGSGTTTPPSS